MCLKGLFEIMRKVIPSYCKNFKCIADKCNDNCCIGWGIYIDDDTAEFYKNVSGEFGERLKKEINFGDENYFMLNENDRCPFLNKNNLCDIITNLGEEHICDICDKHPRFFEWFHDVTEMGVGLCCEEACRLLFKDSEPITFETVIEPGEPDNEDYDEYFYEQLLRARKILFAIAQNRNYTLQKRLILMPTMALDIQKCIDNEDFELLEVVNTQYTAWTFCDRLHNYITVNQKEFDVKKYLTQFLGLIENLIPINEEWDIHLKNVISKIDDIADNYSAFLEYYKDRMYEYEHLLVYFIYRYFMKTVFDYDALSKVKFAVIGYLTIIIFDVYTWLENNREFTLNDRIENVKMYSKDIEYAQLNIDDLAQQGYTNDILSFENLIGILSQ